MLKMEVVLKMVGERKMQFKSGLKTGRKDEKNIGVKEKNKE